MVISDGFLEWIAEKVVESETGTFENIDERVDTVEKCEYILKNSVSGAEISHKIGDPFPSMAYIRMVGKKIQVDNCENFIAVARAASNINVYPKTNGEIQVDLTFHRVAKKVGGV